MVSSAEENTTDFTYVNIYDGSLYLKYSRTQDSLSVKRLILSEGPACMIPADINVQKGKVIHPLEQTIGNGCKTEEHNKRRYDPRFTRLSAFEDTEYSILHHNGII